LAGVSLFKEDLTIYFTAGFTTETKNEEGQAKASAPVCHQKPPPDGNPPGSKPASISLATRYKKIAVPLRLKGMA